MDYSDRYRGKVVLAPMVRCGTLPLRLLALQYGADLVYSEEIVDFKAPFMERVVNSTLHTPFYDIERDSLLTCGLCAATTATDGTIDFFSKGGRAVYRTCPRESGRNIVQIGTSNASRALLAANHLYARLVHRWRTRELTLCLFQCC